METLTEKTINAFPNILHMSSTEKRHFKLEPVQPMSILEIREVLDGLKKMNISWG